MNPQKIVHVHKGSRGHKLFEFMGYSVTTDTLMFALTGVSSAISLSLLLNEINRRKSEASNNNTIAEMQQRINELTAMPNVELEHNGHAHDETPQQQTVQPDYQDKNSSYFNAINQIDDSSVNDVNINTIRPYMDNVNDIAEAKARQQELYQRGRKYYNYDIPKNPYNTQHIITGQQFDMDTSNEAVALPNGNTGATQNAIQQRQQMGNNNMFVGRDGVVRKVGPRREIAINLA